MSTAKSSTKSFQGPALDPLPQGPALDPVAQGPALDPVAWVTFRAWRVGTAESGAFEKATTGQCWGVKNSALTGNIACASFVPGFLTAGGLKGQNMPAQGNALGQ